MRIKTFFVLGLFPLLLAAKAKDPQFVKITKVKTAQMLIGKTGSAIVSVTVGVGMHIQANPASQPNLISTELKLEPKNGFSVGSPIYPEGTPYRLQNSDRDLSTFSGTVEIKVPISAIPGVKLGKDELKGKLRFQACNDKICFFPTSVPVTVPVIVYK